MINVLIIDDEPLALDILETYIEQYSILNLVARCESAAEAAEVLENTKIDLMFLDIQMSDITGIDFYRSLDHPPLVIFCTAYPNFAVEGFELDALDYLLKPVSLERFEKSIIKVKEILPRKTELKPERLKEPDYIFVKADKKLIKINYEDIIYVEGLKDYVIIRTEASRVITLQTMKSLEEKLPKDRFMRIHRSYIVNIDKINAIVGNMVEVSEKGQNKHIPVGKNYRDELTDMINDSRL